MSGKGLTGVIHMLREQGYGFITPDGDGNAEVFFHAKQLQGVQFIDLKAGDHVRFDAMLADKFLKATKVERI